METKSELPSPRKLKQARLFGDVPRSTAFSGGVAAFVLALGFALSANPVTAAFGRLLETTLRTLGSRPAVSLPRDLVADVVASLGPATGILLVLVTAGALLQVGPLFSFRVFRAPTPFAAPIARWVDAVRGAVVVGLVGTAWVAFTVDHRADIGALAGLTTTELTVGLGRLTSAWLWTGAGLLLLLGSFDQIVGRLLWRFRQRMTRSEVRREQRLLEADPRWDHYRRQAHRRVLDAGLHVLSQESVCLGLVGPSGVVAVAHEASQVPRVVFAEQGRLAERARAEMAARDIPVVEDPRLLADLMRFGAPAPVPSRLFEEVAKRLVDAKSSEAKRESS